MDSFGITDTMIFWTGSFVGVLIGLAHAAYVYRVTSNQAPAGIPPDNTRPIYYAVWTLLLWVLFGTYVLVLWLIGGALYIVFKVLR